METVHCRSKNWSWRSTTDEYGLTIRNGHVRRTTCNANGDVPFISTSNGNAGNAVTNDAITAHDDAAANDVITNDAAANDAITAHDATANDAVAAYDAVATNDAVAAYDATIAHDAVTNVAANDAATNATTASTSRIGGLSPSKSSTTEYVWLVESTLWWL